MELNAEEDKTSALAKQLAAILQTVGPAFALANAASASTEKHSRGGELVPPPAAGAPPPVVFTFNSNARKVWSVPFVLQCRSRCLVTLLRQRGPSRLSCRPRRVHVLCVPQQQNSRRECGEASHGRHWKAGTQTPCARARLQSSPCRQTLLFALRLVIVPHRSYLTGYVARARTLH